LTSIMMFADMIRVYISTYDTLLLAVGFAFISLTFFAFQFFQKKKKQNLKVFDTAKHKVSGEPNIWVFDDLLSEGFLNYIDEQFEIQKDNLEFESEENGFYVKYKNTLKLDVDDKSEEVIKVLRKIANFEPHEKCPVIAVSDVWGDDQGHHMDHVDIDDLAPFYQKLNFIDRSKQECYPNDPSALVPTFSFVIYFNDVGSIVFPNIDREFEGKRGRIFMFQNYRDAERPVANTNSTHYGRYNFETPKRVVAMGLLSNKTPDVTQGAPKTEGIMYCPNACSHHAHHAEEDLYAYSVNQIIVSKDHDSIPMARKVTTIYPDGYEGNVGIFYKVTYQQSLINDYFNLSGSSNIIKEYDLTQTAKKSCGLFEEEVWVFIVITDIIGLNDAEAAGWICSCHLCTPEGDVVAQRRMVANEWKKHGYFLTKGGEEIPESDKEIEFTAEDSLDSAVESGDTLPNDDVTIAVADEKEVPDIEIQIAPKNQKRKGFSLGIVKKN